MSEIASEADPGSTPAARRNVRAMGWASFANDVASEMLFPILPLYLTTALGAGPAALGVIEGVADATASVVRLFSGRISDRLRRRKPLAVAGYALANLSRPLIALAGSWHAVLAIRFSDRLGKGLRTAPRDALLAASALPGQRGRAFGWVRGMDHAGAVVGPLVAVALMQGAGLPLASIFWLSLIPGAIAVAIFLFGVTELRPPGIVVAAATGAGGVVTAPQRLPAELRIYVALVGLFSLANASDAFILLLATRAGMPMWGLPLMWSGLHVVKSSFSAVAGSWSDRVGRRPAIVGGWVLYAACYAGFAFASSLWIFLAVLALYGLHYALVEGAEKAYVADLAAEEVRGSAYGLFAAVAGLAALPASAGFGLLWSAASPQTAFLVAAALALAAAAGLAMAPLSRRPA